MVVANMKIRYPIRRLVVTGKDTPENMAILLGNNDPSLVEDIRKMMRIEVLLNPPPGSPMYVVAKVNGYDRNSPIWTPREPSAEEKERLGKIRDMQERITRHMGIRNIEFDTIKMQDFLVAHFPTDWSQQLPYYQDAINSMDQGVPDTGVPLG